MVSIRSNKHLSNLLSWSKSGPWDNQRVGTILKAQQRLRLSHLSDISKKNMTNKNKKITLEEVKKIAELARIEISVEEAEKFSGELSDVLEYVNRLSEVDTKSIEPILQITGLVNVVREDVSEDFDEEMRRELVERAGERKDGYIRVKAVMQGN